MSSHTTTVAISGMTCGHCVNSVTEELTALPAVQDVSIDLNVGGLSTATITSATALDVAEISEAVAEAGYLVVADQA